MTSQITSDDFKYLILFEGLELLRIFSEKYFLLVFPKYFLIVN